MFKISGDFPACHAGGGNRLILFPAKRKRAADAYVE